MVKAEKNGFESGYPFLGRLKMDWCRTFPALDMDIECDVAVYWLVVLPAH